MRNPANKSNIWDSTIVCIALYALASVALERVFSFITHLTQR